MGDGDVDEATTRLLKGADVDYQGFHVCTCSIIMMIFVTLEL